MRSKTIIATILSMLDMNAIYNTSSTCTDTGIPIPAVRKEVEK